MSSCDGFPGLPGVGVLPKVVNVSMHSGMAAVINKPEPGATFASWVKEGQRIQYRVLLWEKSNAAPEGRSCCQGGTRGFRRGWALQKFCPPAANLGAIGAQAWAGGRGS